MRVQKCTVQGHHRNTIEKLRISFREKLSSHARVNFKIFGQIPTLNQFNNFTIH